MKEMVLSALAMCLLPACLWDSDGTPPPAPTSPCQEKLSFVYDTCKVSVANAAGAPETKQQAIDACEMQFQSERCAELAADCPGGCANLESAISSRCGQAYRGACEANIQRFLDCGGAFINGATGTASSKPELLNQCATQVGIAMCFDHCSYRSNRAPRACDDIVPCFSGCYDPSMGMPLPATVGIPLPCPPTDCKQICDFVSSHAGTTFLGSPVATCLYSCQSAYEKNGACIAGLRAATATATTTDGAIANMFAARTDGICNGTELAWLPVPGSKK